MWGFPPQKMFVLLGCSRSIILLPRLSCPIANTANQLIPVLFLARLGPSLRNHVLSSQYHQLCWPNSIFVCYPCKAKEGVSNTWSLITLKITCLRKSPLKVNHLKQELVLQGNRKIWDEYSFTLKNEIKYILIHFIPQTFTEYFSPEGTVLSSHSIGGGKCNINRLILSIR